MRGFHGFRALGLAAWLLAGAAPGQTTIKKCQDAEGRWHYGDTAAAECARSGVTEIDVEGYKVKEQPPPKSEAELEAERQAAARAKAEAEARARQAREDARLLAIYDSEADILRARDERIDYLEAQRQVNRALLEDLRKRLAAAKKGAAADDKNVAALEAQLREYENHALQLDRQIEAVRGRYGEELARYREARARSRPAGGDGKPPAGTGEAGPPGGD